MNIRTGETIPADLLEKRREEPGFEVRDWVMLARKAKRSCRHCYGRGYEGTVPDAAGNPVYLPCRCVRKKPKKAGSTDRRRDVG